MTQSNHETLLQFENPFAPAQGLELKAPPAAVTAVTASLMWAVSAAAPAVDFAFLVNPALSAGLFLAGALICLAGVASFRRAGTTVNPMKPNSTVALVSSGIYKHSRNPMYLGFLVVLLSWALFLSNGLALLFLPAFVLYMEHFQIRAEERVLGALFGHHYTAYRANVRRWL